MVEYLQGIDRQRFLIGNKTLIIWTILKLNIAVLQKVPVRVQKQPN